MQAVGQHFGQSHGPPKQNRIPNGRPHLSGEINQSNVELEPREPPLSMMAQERLPDLYKQQVRANEVAFAYDCVQSYVRVGLRYVQLDRDTRVEHERHEASSRIRRNSSTDEIGDRFGWPARIARGTAVRSGLARAIPRRSISHASSSVLTPRSRASLRSRASVSSSIPRMVMSPIGSNPPSLQYNNLEDLRPVRCGSS